MTSLFGVRGLKLVAATLLLSQLNSVHGARFLGLGNLPGRPFPSYATGVSADGSVIVGQSNSGSGAEAFRWTSGEGMVGLGVLRGTYSSALGVSADGLVVVGTGSSMSGNEAFRWTAGGGMVGLGGLPGGSFDSYAASVSADGSVIVGANSSATSEAFRWTSGGGMVGLGDLPGGDFQNGSGARAVTADGTVVVGAGSSTAGREAFRWTSGEGMVGLGDLPGGLSFSSAEDISADGSVIVGDGNSALGYEAFRWTAGGGMVGLGDLPGGGFESYARGVSADGSVIVGRSDSVSGDEAFIWDVANGMRNLKGLLNELLTPADRELLDDWTLRDATAISADGWTVVGWGTNATGNTEAWLAYLGPEVPEPASCVLIGVGLGVLVALKRDVCDYRNRNYSAVTSNPSERASRSAVAMWMSRSPDTKRAITIGDIPASLAISSTDRPLSRIDRRSNSLSEPFWTALPAFFGGNSCSTFLRSS
jgi:probable HAF family extracellular repeat protein